MNNMPTVTKHLLIWNVLFFMGAAVATKYGLDIDKYLGLHFFLASDFRLYQFFTYMFMHSSIGHIFFNMFAVWMFGRILENTWGPKRFLILYLVCGLGAGIIQEGVQYIHYLIELSRYDYVSIAGMSIPMKEYLNMLNTVGASGAVYGILLGYAMTYPDQPLFIIPFPFPIKAKWLVTGYIVLEIVMGLSNRPGDNVAHFAHLGGMLFAFLLIRHWRRKGIY